MGELYAKKVLSSTELEAIGCVAVESASLEGFIEWSIYKICGLPEYIGRLLLGNMMFGGKLDSLRDLIKECIGAENYEKQFGTIIGDISHEMGKRNTIIHGLWNRFSVPEIVDGKPLISEPEGVALKPLRTGPAREFRALDVLPVAFRLNALHNELIDLMTAHVFLRQRAKQRGQHEPIPQDSDSPSPKT